MQTAEINLNFNKADFEEIHFRNGSEQILLSKMVKRQFILSLVTGAFFIASLIYSIITNKSWGIFTIITLIFVLIVNQLIRKMAPVIKWKRSIKDFLNEQAKFITRKLTLTEKTLTLKQDTTITIVRWEDFKKIVIDDKSICLYGDENFMFPKKSMTWQEFDLLKNQILLKVKT
jgi:YcxB-like protein